MAFYKRNGEELQIAPNSVHSPEYTLLADEHGQHSYPLDGWYWFDSLDEAMVGLPRYVAPGTTISPMQARLALLQAGLLDTVEALIADADRATQIAWNNATALSRSSPLLIGMSTAMGMTDQQLDDLFAAAATIEV